MYFMKFRKVTVALVALSTFAAGTVSYIAATTNTSVSPEQSLKRVELTVDCLNRQIGQSSAIGSTQERIDGCLSSPAAQLKTLDETEQVFEEIVALSSTNTVLRSQCHDIFHELGQTAWKVASENALKPGKGLCGFGYYHGAMFEAIGEDRANVNIEPLITFCESFASTSPDTSSAEWYLCMHGIGHAVTSTTENLQDAETLCETISTTDRTAVAACFSGVLNEELRGGTEKPSQPETAIQMCNMNNETLLGVCYKYTLNYSNVSSAAIEAFCETLPDGSASKGCWAGLGMRLGSTELFATTTSPGYSVVENPAAVANVINTRCLGSKTLQCDTSLLNELAQKVLDTGTLSKLCAFLETPLRQTNCSGIVAQLKPVQLTK
jgi:hypothetical protein